MNGAGGSLTAALSARWNPEPVKWGLDTSFGAGRAWTRLIIPEIAWVGRENVFSVFTDSRFGGK